MATNWINDDYEGWFSDDYEEETQGPQAALPAAPVSPADVSFPSAYPSDYPSPYEESDDLAFAPPAEEPTSRLRGPYEAYRSGIATGLQQLLPSTADNLTRPPEVIPWDEAYRRLEEREAKKPKPEQPIFGLSDVGSAVGGFISALPTTGTEAFYRMKEGSKRPDQFSPEAQAAFAESRALQERMAQEQAEREKAGTSTTIGQAIREATSSSGYTLGSMGPAIAGGLAGAKVGTLAAGPVGGVVGGIVGGFAGSGAAAFTMAQNQFMEDAFQQAEQRMRKTQKRSLNEQEKQALYQEMEPLARDSALWEAGPEAVGNAFMLVGGGIAAGLLGKQGISKLAGGALRKGMIRTGALATGVGMEFATETATELGQALPRARMEAYLEGRPIEDAVSRYAGKPLGGAGEAFEEIWRPTLGTVLMFGLGGTAVKGVSKANERFRQNPQEAEAIVEMTNDPNVLAAMPQQSLENLQELSGFLRDQWFAGSKRQENMSEAIAKISAELQQRTTEDATTQRIRRETLGDLWTRMAPQEQSRVLDFFGATSPGLTGWETKEGAPTGQIDARALRNLGETLGIKGREFQLWKSALERQRAQAAPPGVPPGAPTPTGGVPPGAPTPTPGLSQVPPTQAPPAQDPDIPFAPPAPAAGPTVTAADVEPDTVDVAGQPTVTVTSGMKAGIAQLRQQAAAAGAPTPPSAPAAPASPNLARQILSAKDRDVLAQYGNLTPEAYNAYPEDVQGAIRSRIQALPENQRPVAHPALVAPPAQEPPAPPVAPITPTPGETVRMQQGQEIILPAPADPNKSVPRSESTPEDQAAIRERFGERDRKPKTPPTPTEVIPDAQEVQRQAQAETEVVPVPPIQPVAIPEVGTPASDEIAAPEQETQTPQYPNRKLKLDRARTEFADELNQDAWANVALANMEAGETIKAGNKQGTVKKITNNRITITWQDGDQTKDIIYSPTSKNWEALVRDLGGSLAQSARERQSPMQLRQISGKPEADASGQAFDALLRDPAFRFDPQERSYRLSDSFARPPQEVVPDAQEVQAEAEAALNQPAPAAEVAGEVAPVATPEPVQPPETPDAQAIPVDEAPVPEAGTPGEGRGEPVGGDIRQPGQDQEGAKPAGQGAQGEVAPTPAVTQKVKTPDEQMEVDVGLEVVELADLITSDDARFPKSLQPRGRGERQASTTQVFDIAKGLNPDRLLSSPVTSDGAPIVGPDGLVESGNGRVMAIRTAYGQFQDRADAYRAKLQEQGFDTTGMTAPVLIRRRVSPLDDAQRVEFTQKSNMATVASMSPSERATLHAQRLLSKPAVLDAYRGGDPGLSVNAEFVGRFFQEILDPSERGQFQTKEGMLNAEGKKEIQSAILAAAYPDSALMDTLLESQDNNIKTIGGALREVAPDILQTKAYLRQYPELQSLDLSGPLTEAARLVNQARAENKGLKDILDQQGMFGGIDPTVERLTRLFFSDADLRKGLSQPKLVKILQAYAENARLVQPMDPLFADIPQITVGDLLSTMEKRRDAEIPAEQVDLLGGGAARPSRPASGTGDQRPGADRPSAANGAPGPREGQEDGGKPAEQEVAPAPKAEAASQPELPETVPEIRKYLKGLGATNIQAIKYSQGSMKGEYRVSAKLKDAEFGKDGYGKTAQAALKDWIEKSKQEAKPPAAQPEAPKPKEPEAEVKPEVSRIPSAEVSLLKLAGYAPEAIEAMSAAERTEAMTAANAAADGITVVTPFTLGTQAIPKYVVASGETNAMFGLYERARGSFTHLTNLAANLETALQKAKVYAAARGETQVYDWSSGNLREIQRAAREQDRGGIDYALYGEKGPPVEGAVNPEGRVEPSADALSVDLSLLDDDALLRHFGLDLQERVAKSSGKTYWAITGTTERHKAMLDALGFKDPFKMDGVYWRSVFKENPKAKLVEALRAGGEVRIEPRPTLPRAEAEQVLTQAGLVVTQNPNNPNRWTVEKHPQFKIRGGNNPLWTYKDLLADLGGVFNRSSTDYKVTYRVFDYDPTEALGYAIANADASGSAAGDAQAPRRGGNVHDDPRIRELRQRLDARDDRRLGAGEYRGRVSDDTQRLITEGGDRFHVPQQVQQEQIEDIGMIVRAFEEDAPAFILANAAGTGKTMVMGGAIRELRRLGHQKFVYVTQSRDLIEQIKSDLAAYGVDDVMFHTYAEMSGDTRMDVAGAVIFFDEAHNIKNINDNTARAIRGQQLIARAKMSVFASATPFENPTQAQYLGATGLFDQAQAGEVSGFPFIDWAAAFGAEIETFEYIDRSTGRTVTRHLAKWRSSDASKADAKASREWLAKQGILTQRPMRINPDMVDVEFSRTEVDPYFENLYNEIDDIYDDALIALESGEMDMAQTMDGKMLAGIAMHRENLIKRILEASKVSAAIQETRKLLEAGQNVVIFVETKADRALNRWRKTEGYQKEYGKDDKLYAYPEMQSLMEAWQREVNAWVRTPEELRGPYPKPPFADFIYHLAGFFHQQYGDKAIELPSTAEEIVKAFGKKNVGIYTGAVSTAAANKAKEKFLAGELKILVATMAKGGTGLSLHDKVGNRPTTQLNINLPWTATQVEQVMARVARYGLQSKALVRWMFASNISWEADKLAPKVGARMRDMGATVQGIDVPAAEILASDFDFTGTREIAKRQAAEEPGRMQEAMREAEDFGVVPPAQPDADQRRYSRAPGPDASLEAVRARYAGTPQWMKAPNGQPTKLNERQWLQVRTPEFKTWFGDWENDPANASKVLDENGEPMVVYHGTDNKDFYQFTTDANTGAFFIENYEIAEGYGDRVIAGFLSIKNPILWDVETTREFQKWILENYVMEGEFPQSIINDYNRYVDSHPDYGYEKGVDGLEKAINELLKFNPARIEWIELDPLLGFSRKFAKDKNADGIVRGYDVGGGESRGNEVIAFSPTQIKSATENVGTFSPTDADIRASRADGTLTEVGLTQAQARAEAVEALGETNVRHLERNGFAVWLEPKPGARPLPGNKRVYLSSTGQEVVAPHDAQAFVQNGVMHLIPSNMRTGALNAALHESAHLMLDERYAEGNRTILRMSHAVLNLVGLRNFIGNPGFQDLAEQVQRMAREGNSVALKALAQAQQVDPNRIADESIAYLVEYGDPNLPIVRRILAAIRAALYRMGVKMELRPEDVRQLAVSALKARAQRNKGEQRKLVRLAELERLYEEKYGDLALGELRVEVLRRMDEDTTLEQFRDLVTQMIERRYSAQPSATEVLRLLRDSRFVSDRTALDTLGEFPEYLYEVGKFIAEQRQKLVEGRLTPREVAKAYLITQSSIGSGARSLAALEPAFAKAGMKTADISPLFLNERGGLRPEELAAWWLGTSKGQQALDALEQGRIDREAFEELLTLRESYGRDALRGNSVLGLRKDDGFQWGAAPEKRGDFNLANLLALTGAINATQGDPRALTEVLGRAKGISTGKTGFIGHLLGLGNRPTVDAVEINFWLTGKADTRTTDIAQKAKETVQAIREKIGDRRVREAVFQRINQRLMPLANRLADQYQLPRGIMPHLLHHWLWDKAKGIETTHAGLYEAMRRYSRAWHGTPHEVDRFSSERIGTGEGAQAYGHGLYFAENADVAKFYRNKLAGFSNTHVAFDNVEFNYLGQKKELIESIKKAGYSHNAAVIAIEEIIQKNGDLAAASAEFSLWEAEGENEISGLHREVGKILERMDYVKEKGRLYEVELAPQADEYLLWDKPLSEQSDKVKKALRDIYYSDKVSSPVRLAIRDATYEGSPNTTGEWAYRQLALQRGLSETAADRWASDYLHSIGVRGIKYLDGTSRAKGEGAYNYVIFSDQDVEITARYSRQPVATEATMEEFEAVRAQFQARQAETPFRQWFGKGTPGVTATVDGTPITLYHGTNNPLYTEWDSSRAAEASGHPTSGLGFFMTADKRAAARYGNNLLELHAKIDKPYYLTDADLTRIETRQDAERLRWNLMKQGYDGAVVEAPGAPHANYVIAFKPNQIKFTTTEKPTASPDMRYSRQQETTTDFKNWSRDYPVIEDAKANPASSNTFETGKSFVAKVYHGSESNLIEEFDPNRLGSNTRAESARKGFFFAGNPETTNSYLRAYRAGEGNATVKFGSNFYDFKALTSKEPKEYALGSLYAKVVKPLTFGLYNITDSVRNRLINETIIDLENEQKNIDQSISKSKKANLNKLYMEAAEWLKQNKDAVILGINEVAPTVYPVYARMSNPIVYDQKGKKYRETTYNDLLKQARDNGHDGLVILNTFDGGPLDNIFVVFDNKNIKSYYNVGTYSDSTADIRYSRQPPGQPPTPADAQNFLNDIGGMDMEPQPNILRRLWNDPSAWRQTLKLSIADTVGNTRPAWTRLLSRQQIVEMLQESPIARLAKHFEDTARLLDADKAEGKHLAFDIAKRLREAAAKSRDKGRGLYKLWFFTTLESVDPTQPAPQRENYGDTADYLRARQAHTRAVEMLNELRKANPVLADLYKEVIVENKRSFEAYHQALKDRLGRGANGIFNAMMDRAKDMDPTATPTTLTQRLAKLAEDPAAYDAFTATVRRRLQQPDMKKADAAALRDTLPDDAQKVLFDDIVADVRGKVKSSVDALQSVYEQARVLEPYFPLSRWGDYQVYAEKAGEPKPVFAAFEREQDQRAAIAQLQKEGWTVKVNYDAAGKLTFKPPADSFLGKMFVMVDEMVSNSKERLALKDEFYQMYLRSLPDLSSRKHFLHRKGIPGFSMDALRGFAQLANSRANAIARLKHSDILSESLTDMERALKRTGLDPSRVSEINRAGALLGELQGSYEWMMNPTNATWANRLTSFGFLWHLTNPSTALVNLTQVPIATFPDLAAKFGGGSAFSAISKAIKDYGAWKFHGKVAKEQAMQRLYAEFDGDLGLALKSPKISSQISRTEAVALAGMSDDAPEFSGGVKGSAAALYRGALYYGGWLYQKAEVANREITVIAAYRLARRKAEAEGKTREQAHDYATETAYNSMTRTQGDFSLANRAWFMRGNAMRVMFLFRSFSHMMTFNLLRDAYQSVKGKDAEAKKLARDRLAWTGAASLVFAGATGFPMYTLIAAIANSIWGSDPDDPWDFDSAVRDELTAYGGDTLMRTVMQGPLGQAPRALNLLGLDVKGVDIAPRVSLDLIRLWIRRQPEDSEGGAAMDWWMGQVAGPLYGTARGVAEGLRMLGQTSHDPQAWWRTLEGLTPAPIRNLAKAGRFEEHGVTTRRGDLLMDEFGFTDLITQAIGFTPDELADQYRQNTRAWDLKYALEKRRRNILSRYIFATEQGDDRMIQETMQFVERFNELNPEFPITFDSLRSAYRNFARARALSESGVYIPSQGLRARVFRDLTSDDE